MRNIKIWIPLMAFSAVLTLNLAGCSYPADTEPAEKEDTIIFLETESEPEELRTEDTSPALAEPSLPAAPSEYNYDTAWGDEIPDFFYDPETGEYVPKEDLELPNTSEYSPTGPLKAIGPLDLSDIPDTAASGLILPESSSRLYSNEELNGYTSEDLYFAENELYAKKGMEFESDKLKARFRGLSWYTGCMTKAEAAELGDTLFSETELENRRRIIQVLNEKTNEEMWK